MIAPPPGWQERLDRLLAIYDRACSEFAQAHGKRELIAEKKVRIAYRQIQALLALRPPARAREQANMFAELERQVAVEAQRQRATAPSNDNATASQQERETNNGNAV